MSYEAGDYILIDRHDTIVAVSGNAEFWDNEMDMPPVNPNRAYVIAKVIEVKSLKDKEEPKSEHLHQWSNYLHTASVLVRQSQDHYCKVCSGCNSLLCEAS